MRLQGLSSVHKPNHFVLQKCPKRRLTISETITHDFVHVIV